jgi:carboxymethylenebutenolidase
MDGGRCGAWRADPAPAHGRLPALLLVQEVWGVDGHIQDVTRRLAEAGYLVLAPDLYSLGGKPPALEPRRVEAAKRFLDTLPAVAWGDQAAREQALAALPEPQRSEIAGSLAALFGSAGDLEAHLPTLLAAAAKLRAGQRCDGRVAALGFCMGGGLAALLACVERELAAAVVFYGPAPPAERVPDIRCPLLGLYGADDHRITDAVPALAETMRAAGKRFEYEIYPGAPHAFFNDTRSSYRPRKRR